MMSRCLLLVVLLGMAVGLPMNAAAAPTECQEWAAKIVSIEGRVESLRAGDKNWQAVNLNDTYCPNDRVRTLENSRAAIQLQNETILRLDQNTVVRFSGIDPQSPTLLELIRGSAFFLSRFPRTLTIETPFVNAASGGTEFHIEVNERDQTTTITVIEGQMNVTNEAGSTVVKGGEAAVTKAGQAPVLRVVVRARDAIQWALYYPPVLSSRDLHLGGTEDLAETDWRSMVQRSIDSYRDGDVTTAFSAIEGAPEEIPDPRFYTYRVSLLLSVGRVDQARADIDKALGLAPRDSLALALKSIMAVVQNEPDKALRLAEDATEADPDSVSVRIALSYAQQANFNLPEALAAANEAVKQDPEASLAWARSAELWMSQGHLDEALDAAKKAEALNPKEVRIQTVLGFAYLTQIKIAAAKNAFDKAIALNSSDPLPRLGLGLAKIREGDLEQGRKEIEIAATLDPNNALIRSYLGKAYYEEKRDSQAAIQLDMAKELDPMDPTPYLYDAIRKQTINRPVEALHDLQESIKLNDNRAVYRSRFLLDNDLAARSVSLGRIYEDLGFQQLALVEGWKSVNIDPTNYSAHRFLADSYATLPQSEIARLSELLQSQLLQPINSHPVQPSLGDSSAISAGAGSVNAAFNEYSQLFDRDRTQLLASGLVGEHHTWGEEVILTGLQGRYSWSLGQFRYVTDGWRENSEIDQDLYSVFMQANLTHKLSIHGEIRFSDTENGDLGLLFDQDNLSPTLDIDTEIRTYRLGLHYAPAPTSDIILSGFYQDRDERQHEPIPPDLTITSDGNLKAYTTEAQYLLRIAQSGLVIGAGYYAGPETIDASVIFIDPDLGPLPILEIKGEDHIRHTNLYLYSLINLPAHGTLTIGGSLDWLSIDFPATYDRSQFNPKLGFTWKPTSSTTLRLSGSRSLRRTLISNQTIEPTQVAGFQQFFEDLRGTDSKQYGVGIDQEVSSDLFGGVEFTKRDLETPSFEETANGFEVRFFEGDIKQARAYVYWTLSTGIAASAEYYLERSNNVDLYASSIKTRRIPLGLNFYLPHGLFVKIKASYLDQEGDFYSADFSSLDPGQARFWVCDTLIGYRLPRRLGIVTVGADNLFDRESQFHDLEQGTSLTQSPKYQPARFLFTKMTITF